MVQVAHRLLRKNSRQLNYYISLDCSSDNISPSGYVYSPRYPTVYPYNMNCKQYIEVPLNRSVKIEIQDFWLETCCDTLRVSSFTLPISIYLNVCMQFTTLVFVFLSLFFPFHVVIHVDNVYDECSLEKCGPQICLFVCGLIH